MFIERYMKIVSCDWGLVTGRALRFTWVVSLPAAGSTASCMCFCVSLNFGLKWIWQRPRPLWLDMGKVSEVWNIGAVWEGDYSFPSGHSQSLAGVLLCAHFTFQLTMHWLPVMLMLGAFVGLSRNYLGVHWCSDTLSGWLIGSLSGIAWGLLDPYAALLRLGDPIVSVAVGLGSAFGVILLAAACMMMTTPVQPELRAEWLQTAVRGLAMSQSESRCVTPEDEMDDSSKRRRCSSGTRQPPHLRPRHLVYAAGPAISGGMCLALTGAYAELPPHTMHCLETQPPLHIAILRVLVGLVGVAVMLLVLAWPLHVVKNVRLEDGGRKATVKVLLLLLLCSLAPVWVFLLSQLLLEELGLGCGLRHDGVTGPVGGSHGPGPRPPS
eukprot:s117_g12.t1